MTLRVYNTVTRYNEEFKPVGAEYNGPWEHFI